MTDVTDRQTQEIPTGLSRTGMTANALKAAISDHLLYSICRPAAVLTTQNYYTALALAVRDRLQGRWMPTTQTFLTSARRSPATCRRSS